VVGMAAARLCNVSAIYAEPPALMRERIGQFRAQAASFGRVPGFNVSVRPIIAKSEGAVWDRAHHILTAMKGKRGWSRTGTCGPARSTKLASDLWASLGE